MLKNIENVTEETVTTLKSVSTGYVEIEPAMHTTNYVRGSTSGNKCHHCGESYYMEKYSTCTAMYCPPIYKNGVNVNPDRNITTTYCECINCGKEFVIKR